MKENVFSIGECIMESWHSYVLEDAYPVTYGHVLIIPKRDVYKLTELENNEVLDIFNLTYRYISEKGISDYNFGCNQGSLGGQTVRQLHFHIIPRSLGDAENPRGGVRNVIPDKGDY